MTSSPAGAGALGALVPSGVPPRLLRHVAFVVVAGVVVLLGFEVLGRQLVHMLGGTSTLGDLIADRSRFVITAIGVSIVAPPLLLAIGTWFYTRSVIGAWAAVIVAYDVYALGRVSNDVAALGKTLTLTPANITLLSTLALQALLVAVTLCLAMMVFKGNWATFSATGLVVTAVLAISLAAWSALNPEAPEPVPAAQVTIEGRYLGIALADGQDVTVVFVIPKLDADGRVIGYEAKPHAAEAVGVGGCTVDGGSCTLRVSVERGSKDAGIAAFLADSKAAERGTVTIIGPGATPGP